MRTTAPRRVTRRASRGPGRPLRVWRPTVCRGRRPRPAPVPRNVREGSPGPPRCGGVRTPMRSSAVQSRPPPSPPPPPQGARARARARRHRARPRLAQNTRGRALDPPGTCADETTGRTGRVAYARTDGRTNDRTHRGRDGPVCRVRPRRRRRRRPRRRPLNVLAPRKRRGAQVFNEFRPANSLSPCDQIVPQRRRTARRVCRFRPSARALRPRPTPVRWFKHVSRPPSGEHRRARPVPRGTSHAKEPSRFGGPGSDAAPRARRTGPPSTRRPRGTPTSRAVRRRVSGGRRERAARPAPRLDERQKI